MLRKPVAPTSEAEWEIRAKQFRVKSSAMHEIDVMGSGSKVTEEQFLVMRVLWREHRKDSKSITDKIDTKWYEQSKTILDEDKQWQGYLKDFDENSSLIRPLGLFGLVKLYRQQVCGIQENSTAQDSAKFFFTPVGKRTRSQMARLAQIHETPTKRSGASQLEVLTPQTPEKQIVSGFGNLSLQSDIGGRSLLGSTPDSPLDAALLAFKYPQTPDESTVNVALLTLLNALTADTKELLSPWKLDRYALHFNHEGRKVYEARVDGYLPGTGNAPLALIEVKARSRQQHTHEIRKQESAQMVAWILQEAGTLGRSERVHR